MAFHLSLEEGIRLSKDSSTCVEIGQKVRHISLPWTLMGSAHAVVERLLNSSLGKYSAKLEGVPLAVGKIKYVEDSGKIIQEQPVMHLHVLADYAVFRPRREDLIKGTVARVGNHSIIINAYQGVSIIGKLDKNMEEVPNVGDVVTVKALQAKTHAKFFTVSGHVVSIEKAATPKKQNQHLVFNRSDRSEGDKSQFDPLEIVVLSQKKKKAKKQEKTTIKVEAEEEEVAEKKAKKIKQEDQVVEEKAGKRRRRQSSSSGTEVRKKKRKIKSENVD